MSPGIIDNNEIIYNFTDVFTACSLLRSGQASYVHFSKENIYCEIVKKNCWKSHNWKWKSFYKIKIVGVSCLCLHVYLWDEKNTHLTR